ncbi:hypothetical protein BD770DRAFT_465863 [Pilaira anomala]|nr:hypothetical protein BD770DRAFT_465863 [Pilaira anomala]
MNILHHKRQNIEKVKADEAEAEKQAKAKQDRVILAESEARLELLRKKANVNLPIEQTIKPFNLFEDIATAVEGNPEHEAEVKQENEKWDKQITMYLGKGTKKEDDPWYIKNEEKVDKYKDISTFKSKHPKRKRPIKLLEDPLDLIKSTLKTTEKKKERKRTVRRRIEREKESKLSELSPIELLREKRLAREKEEKMRLNKLYLDSEDTTTSDLPSGYNSQFNRLETEQAQKSRRIKARRS